MKYYNHLSDFQSLSFSRFHPLNLFNQLSRFIDRKKTITIISTKSRSILTAMREHVGRVTFQRLSRTSHVGHHRNKVNIIDD